jgi:hypothetical protein
MKYSIRGNLSLTDELIVIETINKYTLWKLDQGHTTNPMTEEQTYRFEVWVNTIEDKTSLFNELKPIVDEFGETIDWHECTHDELQPQPCVIAEEYVRAI